MTTELTWLSAGESEVPDRDEWLSAAEVERLRRMPYTKRREESRLGRWTAKHAVADALGVAAADVTIANAVDGAPEAFVRGAAARASISMTDRAGWAVCSVWTGGDRVGCDLELVEPRSQLFVNDYFTADERTTVAGAQDRDLAANLIWSAKETALKVLRTGLRRDTRSVEVTLGSAGNGWSSLHVTTVEGDVFPGWWRRFGDFVLTIAAATRLPLPISLIEPPPLTAAVPTHSWMEHPKN